MDGERGGGNGEGRPPSCPTATVELGSVGSCRRQRWSLVFCCALPSAKRAAVGRDRHGQPVALPSPGLGSEAGGQWGALPSRRHPPPHTLSPDFSGKLVLLEVTVAS